MRNEKINAIEKQVYKLNDDLIVFKVELEKDGRTIENYNHLGTLNLHCRVLKKQLERLIETLDY